MEGEAFYSLMIMSQSFSEPVPLDLTFLGVSVFSSPLRRDRMPRMGYSWIFSFFSERLESARVEYFPPSMSVRL